MAEHRPYIVRGVDPASGRVVEHRVSAETERDARLVARGLGWEMISVSIVRTDSGRREATDRPILVVDDDLEIGNSLVRVLRMEGYDAAAVSGRLQARDFIESSMPLLVITDFMMPDGNGLTLITEMRRHAHMRGVPIIMFSGCDDEVKQTALRAGVDSFVSKGSLDWAKLRAEIHRLVGPGPRGASMPEIRPARARDAG